MKVRAWNAVVSAQISFGLVPEILDAIDVGSTVDKSLAMIDPMVPEAGYVQHIICRKTVGIDDGIWFYALLDDGYERVAAGIADDYGVHHAAALEQTKHGHLARRTATSFAFAPAAKIALIEFNFTAQQIGRGAGQIERDHLAQLVVK
jgi:hypothetical protein